MYRSASEALLVWALRLIAATAGCVVVAIAGFLLIESWTALRAIGPARFVTDPSWHPTSGHYNIMPILFGTLAVAGGAVLIAAPIGVGSAIFCHHYAPPALARVYRRMVETLAGIPSVVLGFWGLVVLVPVIARVHPPGPSLLAGVLTLAIMILPTMAMVADAGLACVPAAQVQGAAALGLSRWGTLRAVVLPHVRECLYTGVMLQAGRALGETMAVLMVCGNVVQIPGTPFEPVRTLSANIALEMAYAMGAHRSALFVSGLVLAAAMTGLVIAADRLCRSSGRG